MIDDIEIENYLFILDKLLFLFVFFFFPARCPFPRPERRKMNKNRMMKKRVSRRRPTKIRCRERRGVVAGFIEPGHGGARWRVGPKARDSIAQGEALGSVGKHAKP